MENLEKQMGGKLVQNCYEVKWRTLMENFERGEADLSYEEVKEKQKRMVGLEGKQVEEMWGICLSAEK